MKIEINVPTKLSEITLDQYQRFIKIVETNQDVNFINSKMIEIYCGIPLSDAYKLKVSSVNAIIDILNDLFEVKPSHVERFTMKGIKYGFIPYLDDMTLGEYIDLDNNISDWDKMHFAMNVLYRKVKNEQGKLYNIEEYNIDHPEAMKNMPMDAVLGSLFFFLNLGVELSEFTILSLAEGEQMTFQQKQILEASTGGIQAFTHSLKEMLQGLRISLN